MKSTSLFFTLICLLHFSCTPEIEPVESPIDGEVKILLTVADQIVYLENLFADDQKYRIEESDILLKYGYESPEYKALIQKVILQDSVNVIKVEKYLALHGHPQLAVHGEIATITPKMVIHHSTKYEDRERNFEQFYAAHLRGDIDLSRFLGRMYQMKFGERFVIEGKYDPTLEIDQLIKHLNLDDQKLKVERNNQRL